MSGRRRRLALALGLAAAGTLAAAVARRPGRTPPITDAGAPDPIAELAPVRIGGVDQWVLIRGHDRANPVVLFVHGGPGASQLTQNRRGTATLERRFTVVNWDQRGAGKSFAAGRDIAAMTVDRFVGDVCELAEHLRTRFGQERIVLVGHSWGSVIGALAAQRRPDLFACYVGIGQVADMVAGEAETYRWALDAARAQGDAKAVRTLEEIGAPPYGDAWLRKTIAQRRLLTRLGGASRHGEGPLAFFARHVIASPEYTAADVVNYARGAIGSMKALWPELMGMDLFERVPSLAVPVLLAEGRHDHQVPAEIAARWFDALDAPSKELVWFEDSGHGPNREEGDRFDRLLLDRVRPLATT